MENFELLIKGKNLQDQLNLCKYEEVLENIENDPNLENDKLKRETLKELVKKEWKEK